MIVLVTNHLDLHQANASCVGVSPCFSAISQYSLMAVSASDVLEREKKERVSGRRDREGGRRREALPKSRHVTRKQRQPCTFDITFIVLARKRSASKRRVGQQTDVAIPLGANFRKICFEGTSSNQRVRVLD